MHQGRYSPRVLEQWLSPGNVGPYFPSKWWKGQLTAIYLGHEAVVDLESSEGVADRANQRIEWSGSALTVNGSGSLSLVQMISPGLPNVVYTLTLELAEGTFKCQWRPQTNFWRWPWNITDQTSDLIEAPPSWVGLRAYALDTYEVRYR